MKKTISLIHGWIHGSTCSRKQQMHNNWIFTAVFSNMTNHSFNFFVSFSINDWKNKRWKFKYLPFLRRNTELYLLLSTHREWDSFFVASCKCCQQRATPATIEVTVVYLQCSVSCHVNLVAPTVFENISFPFFLRKLTSICRQNWSCEEIPSSQNSDKAASFSAVVINKNIASSVWKSTTLNHFVIKSRC